ncbi:uncharacterized protein LOC143589247 [Bidens hawaiensis]|uniref:uncharacterized protein LOC143589247 n=1 Tax=Bidens hawaiensis TaxID=980011 RepID=UPI00404AFF9B
MEIVSNDCGVRLYEARVLSMSLMEVVDVRMNNELVAWEDIDQQDPQFSPLFYVQVTNFKCGGYSIGFSCSLLVIDPFTFTTFLKQWANIHNSILSKHQIPKLSLFYLPNFQNTANPDSTTTSLTGQDKGVSVVFKAKPLSSSVNFSLDAALCIEEVESKHGKLLDNGSKYIMIVKRASGETKAETFVIQKQGTKQEQMGRLVCENWDGLLKDDDMILENIKMSACVSYWIS